MPADDDVDLGELSHGPSAAPMPTVRQRLRSGSRLPWRLITVTVVVSLVVGTAAWQISARRVRDQLRPQLQASPVLAWLSAATPSGSGQQQVVVHVANLTKGPVRIERVISRPGALARPVTARLHSAVTVGPGAAGSAVVDLATECGGPYAGAAIAVQIGYGDPLRPATTRHVVVAVDEDPAVGPSYPTVLNQVCSRSARFGMTFRISGVFVSVPSIDGYVAEVVLTSQVHTPRAVQIDTSGPGSFRVLSSPSMPLLLEPGQARRIELRIRVDRCTDLAAGEDWAQGAQLEVARLGGDRSALEDPEDLTAIGLFDVLYPILDAASHERCPAQFS
jgi:hypothetical protein